MPLTGLQVIDTVPLATPVINHVSLQEVVEPFCSSRSMFLFVFFCVMMVVMREE